MGRNRGLVCLFLVSISVLSTFSELTAAPRRVSASVGKSLQDFDFLRDLGIEFSAPEAEAAPDSQPRLVEPFGPA